MTISTTHTPATTISVVMSVYAADSPAFLDEALRSIWTDQTRRPDQVVIVEDGPLSQELHTVISRWQQEMQGRMTILGNDRNMGLTHSLNRALAVATGDLIARMDSDDRSAPDRFMMQERYMAQHPYIDILGGAMQEFNDRCPCLNIRHYPLSAEAARATLCRAAPVAHPSVMMRRRMFDAGLRYDERYRISQDIALWFDAVCAGYRISNLPDVVLFFRRADDVYRRRGRVKAWNEFRIYMRGIRRLYGWLTPKYLYPLLRLLFRLMPSWIVRWGYGSGLRRRIAERS